MKLSKKIEKVFVHIIRKARAKGNWPLNWSTWTWISKGIYPLNAYTKELLNHSMKNLNLQQNSKKILVNYLIEVLNSGVCQILS